MAIAQIEPVDDKRARIHLGVGCALDAEMVVSPYREVLGQGYVLGLGTLRLEPGTTCRLDDGEPMAIAGGTATLREGGVLELIAAGAYGATLKFTGHLVDQQASQRDPSTVKVHVLGTSSWRVRRGTQPEPALEQQEGSSWRPVCEIPCIATARPDAVLRVAGSGVTTSAPFTLPRGRPSVAVDAHVGLSMVEAAGWLLTVLAAGMIGGGSAMVGYGVDQDKPGLWVPGVSIGISGLAVLIPGLIMVLTSKTTVATSE
jgi:hypothetical protein